MEDYRHSDQWKNLPKGELLEVIDMLETKIEKLERQNNKTLDLASALLKEINALEKRVEGLEMVGP